MKLNKTVLAVAIAGIAAAPMMASATTTMSGAVQLQFAGSDTDDCDTDNPPLDADGNLDADAVSDSCVINKQSELFNDGDARIKTGDVIWGISASQALNSGLTGYGALRVDLDTFSGGDVGSADNVYVGVKGGFGDLRIGEVANPGEYGQVSDINTDMGETINQGIGYVGAFGGATVGLSYSPAPNQDVFGVGAKFAWNGLSIGVGMQNLDELTNVSAMVGFSYAGASISVGGVQIEEGAGDDDETAIVAKVGYSIAGVSLGLTFDAQSESEVTAIRFDAGYDLGGGMDVSARINSKSDGIDSDNDSSDWRIQFAKSF